MPAIVDVLRAGRAIARTYGVRGATRRFVHEMRKRRGRFLAAPTKEPVEFIAKGAVDYAPQGDASALPPALRALALERGERVVHGEFEAFGHDWRPLPGSEIEWRTDPLTGYTFDVGPWWKIPHSPSGGDIKQVWEPARFAWTFDLVRAYAVSGDRRYANAFHSILARWMEANPPYGGVQWWCGQETGIRALAILHAEAALPADAEEAKRIVSMLAWSAERIEDAIGYGLSQRNNHGISESAALICLGVRLRGSDSRAEAWIAEGRRLIEEQLRDQFSPDGWYAQHSFNYMRLALEQALTAQRSLAAIGASLSAGSLALLDASVTLLSHVVDSSSGVVPNHGHNDGARVLPLSATRHRDFRPVLTYAAVVLSRSLPADIPADPQVMWWLGAREVPKADARGDAVVSGASGWAVARVRDAAVFMRAGKYRHRPSHLDSLHIDVRFDGKEIVVDPGTYAYNALPPWRNGLAGARVHNAPFVDDEEPAKRGPGFLWYSWPSATLTRAELTDGKALLEAELDGIAARRVEVSAGAVNVTDSVIKADAKHAQVTWLLHPEVSGDSAVEAANGECVEASEGDTAAWFSPTYGLRIASRAVRVGWDPRRVRSIVSFIRAPQGAARA